MCAIIGWAGKCKRGQWRQVHHLLTELLIASACRGIDATGFAALDQCEGFMADKAPIPSDLFTAENEAWNRLSCPSCLVAHCRAATHGLPDTGDNRNNHPFVSKQMAVVVNGVASNYREVAAVNQLNLNSECDSEVVLRLIESARNVPTGISDCLQQLDGGMAVAVLEAKHKAVWIARNDNRPTWIFQLNGVQGYFACSTRDIAEEALFRTFGRSTRHLVDVLIPLATHTAFEMSAAGTLVAAHRHTSHSRNVSRGLILE